MLYLRSTRLCLCLSLCLCLGLSSDLHDGLLCFQLLRLLEAALQVCQLIFGVVDVARVKLVWQTKQIITLRGQLLTGCAIRDGKLLPHGSTR